MVLKNEYAVVVIIIALLVGGGFGYFYGQSPIAELREEVAGQVAQFQEQLTEIDDYVGMLTNKTVNLQGQTEQLQNQLIETLEDFYSTQFQLNETMEDLYSTKSSLEDLQTSYSDLEGEYEELKLLYSVLQQEYNSLELSYETVKGDYDKLQENYARAQRVVAILVDADITLEIQENLNQYVVDIETIYSDTRLLTYSENWKSPEEIRSFIQDLYYSNSGISGVILVGELPYEIWEYYPGDIGPLPYYYEDLDGIFQDLNNDGMLDYHIEEDQKPEIWVSWMRPHSDNIAQSINDYLQKCHLYYSGNISYQDKALVAIDQDWIDATTEVTLALLEIYQENEITVINGTAGISPQEYLNEYIKQYEFTLVWSHSDNDEHEFIRGVVTATTIKLLDNGSKIILIWGCHAADFYKSPYKGDILASSYVFNNIGMASIAATRSIGIENYWIVISGLAEGDIMGEAFLKWINYSYNQIFIENRFPDEEFNKFMWGFILMGDPFIQLNKFQQLLN